MERREVLANQIFGDDSKDVLDFLMKEAPEKELFRTEKTFLNFVARKLQPKLIVKANQSARAAAKLKKKFWTDDRYIDRLDELHDEIVECKQNEAFWLARAESMDICLQINKAKNVLWCIRLLKDQDK